MRDYKSHGHFTLIAIQSCKELTLLPSQYWKNISIILLPQSHWIAKDLQLNIDSRVYSMDPNQQIYEMYKVNPWDTSIIENKIGQINNSVDLAATKNIWERRSNLSSLHLTIIYADMWPNSAVNKVSNTNDVIQRGYTGS